MEKQEENEASEKKKEEMFVFSEKAYVIHHMAALVQSSRATASFRIPAGSFHSCQPTRKKARVMDKIRGRNKAITMHSTPVYRGQGRIPWPGPYIRQ